MARRKPVQEIILNTRLADCGYYNTESDQCNKLVLIEDSEEYIDNVFPYKLQTPFAYRMGYTVTDKPFVDPSGGPFITVGTNMKELSNIGKDDVTVFDIVSSKTKGLVIFLEYGHKREDDNPV